VAKINLSKKEGVIIIKLAQEIIKALEEEKQLKTIRKSEDDHDNTAGYVNRSGGYE
tara:strand:+ start:1602 stop:1769 length:168 start_codon:yes stop_codon:yes gene_type:complete